MQSSLADLMAEAEEEEMEEGEGGQASGTDSE